MMYSPHRSPDVGFITWSEMVYYVQQISTILPDHHILVDIDDGYCDVEVACHVVSVLESSGASGVVLEDQKRPRRCGHFDGKQILDLDEYLGKLDRVLAARRDLFVVARTDSSDAADIERRVTAFANAGVKLVIYSTPCLFAAQPAIEAALTELQHSDGSLAKSQIGVKECNKVLQENLARRTAPQLIARPSERRK